MNEIDLMKVLKQVAFITTFVPISVRIPAVLNRSATKLWIPITLSKY